MLSIYDLVYESLVQIDENYMPQPYLAERWEESSGGKYWTFYLRRDVSFTDGTPLTAADVVASAQYILDKANDENITDHGFYSNLKYFVSGISAKDDYTVTVKTSRPYFGLLYAMTFPVVPAAYVKSLPAHLFTMKLPQPAANCAMPVKVPMVDFGNMSPTTEYTFALHA